MISLRNALGFGNCDWDWGVPFRLGCFIGDLRGFLFDSDKFYLE